MFTALLATLTQGLAYTPMVFGVFLGFRVLNIPDLTVDASFTLGGAVAGALLAAGIHPGLATLAALVAGALAGMATGLLATKGRVAPLLAGILTMTALYSLNLRVMGRSNISLLRRETLFSMVERLGGTGPFPSLAFLGLLVVGLLLALIWFLHTSLGTAVRATGDNEMMMQSLGTDPDGLKVFGLAMANALVALSGAIVAQYQGFADIGMGIGTVVAGLASVILGEVLLQRTQTRWAIGAAITGSLIFRFVTFAALRVGWTPTDLKLLTAILVILALATPRLKSLLRLAT